MTLSDMIAICRAALRGNVSVNSGNLDKRITWAAFDTINRQVIAVKPFKTAWFFTFRT